MSEPPPSDPPKRAIAMAAAYVFAGDGVVYFVFFDRGKMVDFTFVSS